MFHRAFAIVSTLITLSMPALGASAPATNPANLSDYLHAFHRDPKTVMNTPLAKFDSNGVPLPVSELPIGTTDPIPAAALVERNSIRDQICRSIDGRGCEKSRDTRLEAANETNDIKNFIYTPTVNRNLFQMEQAGQLQGVATTPPWSDSYWPMKLGLLARRWMQKEFPNSETWLDNYNFFLAHPTSQTPVNWLSPAEKYDLLVGDGNLTLTQSQWGAGKAHQDARGAVPGWAGLCHGWSPASIMVPNPQKAVNVVTPAGQTIPMYPSDIKALAALAWGEASPAKKKVGGRCDVLHPKEDPVGRVIDEDCFDVNPGTWHMAVVHQLSTVKRSFIMDATYDMEVWNYPVYSYQYVYFNPQTLATSTSIAGALTRVDDFTIDKFKSYRSPLARYVVGIAMDVNYVIPTQPSTTAIPTPLFHSIRYVYDLELDDAGNILGGEWYSNFHPDFLWNPIPDTHPMSAGELAMPVLLTWSGDGLVPDGLRQAALTSSQEGQPVNAIVDALVRKSNAP